MTVSNHNKLREVLGDFELPVFSSVVIAALERIADEDSSFQNIADLIAADPGLSVHLLRLVNSAAFSPVHAVRSVHHAVCLLGRNRLESVLVSLAMRETLPRHGAIGYEPARFWRTSARRATTAGMLAELIDPSNRSESFTASLLQDIAIPILAHRLEDTYGPLLEFWHEEEDELVDLEKSAFGWDHPTVASWLCEEWKIPEHLGHSIATHHDLTDIARAQLPVVHLVAPLREVNDRVGVERLVERTRQWFGTPEDQVMEIVQRSYESADELAELFV